MECRDAQFYLRMRRHATDELGADVTAPLDDHLAGCPACAAEARARTSFDRAVAAAMVAVPVPAGLRGRLVSHTAAKRGADLRRKAYRAVAALAASVLLAGIALGVFTHTRPGLDTYAMVEVNDAQLSEPERSTQEWLTAQKFPDRLPLPFDYDLLTERGYEKVQGATVPVVVFRSREGSGFVKVYLFARDGGLDPKNAPDAQASLTTAKVFTDPERYPGVTYVFVHTGGPQGGLEQFLLTRGNGGG